MLFLVAYFIIVISLVIAFIFTKRIFRWILGVLITIVFIFPLFFITFLGIFKSQIQQGKMLSPQIGAFLLLVFPPKDLFEPLASEYISYNKNEYEFLIMHKYVGHHNVDISFKKLPFREIAENDFKVRLTVENNGKIIYDNLVQKGLPYWGRVDSGLIYQFYEVPKDMPIDMPLTVKVRIEGGINAFIERYGPTKIIIRHGSDE